jgi:hypothetical protein
MTLLKRGSVNAGWQVKAMLHDRHQGWLAEEGWVLHVKIIYRKKNRIEFVSDWTILKIDRRGSKIPCSTGRLRG